MVASNNEIIVRLFNYNTKTPCVSRRYRLHCHNKALYALLIRDAAWGGYSITHPAGQLGSRRFVAYWLLYGKEINGYNNNMNQTRYLSIRFWSKDWPNIVGITRQIFKPGALASASKPKPIKKSYFFYWSNPGIKPRERLRQSALAVA